MPQKILLYRFPTEKTQQSYPHALEKIQKNREFPGFRVKKKILVGGGVKTTDV
jgi:FKBP-type peptidyl-prolyl cis-trans isomerase (trigger factor)